MKYSKHISTDNSFKENSTQEVFEDLDKAIKYDTDDTETRLMPVSSEDGYNKYDQYEIMEFYHSGNIFKREQAIKATVETMDLFVRSVIEQKYGSFVKDKEDLYQLCIMKIIEDLDTYDPDKGAMTTWFNLSIINACNQYLSEEYHHSTPYYANNSRKVKLAIDKFEKSGHKWSVTDLIKETKLSRINVETALIMIEQIEKEGALTYETDSNDWKEEKSKVPTPEISFFDDHLNSVLYAALEQLSPLQRRIVELRNGFCGTNANDRRSLEEIADITGEKLSKIKKENHLAYRKLRNNAELKEYHYGEHNINPMNGYDLNLAGDICGEDLYSDENDIFAF